MNAKYAKLLAIKHTEETTTPDPEDAWDRASTSSTWEVTGVTVGEQDEYGAVRLCFDPATAQSVYAVYAIYSTGDSFGHDDGSDLELIDVFQSVDKAQAAAAALSGSDDSWVREDGSIAKMDWKPWEGYFESLDSMNIRAFVPEVTA